MAVGLSGGVDSAAALFFLMRRGYRCTGVHLRLADLTDAQADRQREEAAAVAAMMDVPFYTVDRREEFSRFVTDYFTEEYRNGRTPNPCVACNEKVRWKALTEFGEGIGIRLVATGHYARIVKRGGRYGLAVPMDRKKDQTYFLYRLSQEYLSRTLFPLGDDTKEKVRIRMEQNGMHIARKPDSQEICFLPDGDREKWFGPPGGLPGSAPDVKASQGDIVDREGKVLGRHKGICFYTVGQRKGLGITGPEPLYVQKIDKESGQVVVAGRKELYSTEVLVRDTVWMGEPGNGLRGAARVRSSGPLVPCVAAEEECGRWKLTFAEPVWAMAPGQSAVFYQDGMVVFGGIMEDIHA